VVDKTLSVKKEEIDMIREFQDEYRFLSNFYPCTVVCNGISFRSAEAAFQAEKIIDHELRKDFADMSPHAAKQYGKIVQLRPDWEDIKLGAMQKIINAKFTQNKDLMEKLLETESEQLIEGNVWHDNDRGVCHCFKCRNKTKKNNLGKCLMRLRDALQKDQWIDAVIMVQEDNRTAEFEVDIKAGIIVKAVLGKGIDWLGDTILRSPYSGNVGLRVNEIYTASGIGSFIDWQVAMPDDIYHVRLIKVEKFE